MNPPKKQTKNKVTNLLASVAMDVLNQPEQVGLQNDQIVTGGDLENVLVVQEPVSFQFNTVLTFYLFNHLFYRFNFPMIN